MSRRADLPPVPDLADTGRVWLENLQPCSEHGRFPIKRVVGETVTVSIDAVVDGHDRITLALRHRRTGDDTWTEAPMHHVDNDRWEGAFIVTALHPHEYTVAGWVDHYASWLDGVQKKAAVGQDVTLELLDGARLVSEAAERAERPDRTLLDAAAVELASDLAPSERLVRAASANLVAMVRRHADRSRQTTYAHVFAVDVARERARTGAWYEFFPRSAAAELGGGGLRTAARRLPAVAAMGFDVVYLPPIHPIGRRFRKGPNNTLEAGPDDPGSPWAIGAEEGGHTAIHPELGDLDDLAHFLRVAATHRLEVAMDIAFQCAPDHPWVKERPSFFKHRPDGTVQYAENPPKKYQDIYPLDFESRDWQALWEALYDVIAFWCEQGVRIFRVDNPHTKPIRFWQWVIARIKRTWPEAVFLAEAFTRPKLMYALAKAGFDQSYTYFTWRNGGQELRWYLEELTNPPASDIYRPNFFTNTPDILPQYLQFGGPAAFKVRLVLAATLAASYGIYSGFELCENEALPGGEEYHASEKFEVRIRDWDRPGSLAPLITAVNAIRRENPALLRNDGLRFHPTSDEQILCYSRTTPGEADTLITVVNLDPHHAHAAWVTLPLADLGLGPRDNYQLHDLLADERFLWQGERNYVELAPDTVPARIFRLRRHVRTERDFDYYM